MPPKMSNLSRHEYLQTLQYHYIRASDRAAKARLLDSAQQTLKVGRKYLIRLFARACDSRPPKPRLGGMIIYGNVLKGSLKEFWLLMGQPCGKLMRAGLGLWIPSWERRHGCLEPGLKSQLEKVSAAQIDRMLRSVKMEYPLKIRPHPANEVRRQIPIREGPWQAAGPGWFEADTVFHGGGNPCGSFIRSLCMVDIYSGWTEVRATWNQSDLKVHARLREIEHGLPMPILGFDTDNGSEMINEAVLRYLRDRKDPVEVTRSRPYHKNDNAHVEQKNRTHVRELLGYERFDHLELVDALNELERAWSLLRNLYSPTLKLEGKERHGARLIKRYEKHPQTPWERIQLHPGTSEATKTRLKELMSKHDPLSLRDEVERKLGAFHALKARLEREREKPEGQPADLEGAGFGLRGAGHASLRSASPAPLQPSPAPSKSKPRGARPLPSPARSNPSPNHQKTA
jgi:hypothetical protein